MGSPWLTRGTWRSAEPWGSTSAWVCPPRAGPRRFRRWRTRRSKAAKHFPTSGACPVATSPEFSYLKKKVKTTTKNDRLKMKKERWMRDNRAAQDVRVAGDKRDKIRSAPDENAITSLTTVPGFSGPKYLIVCFGE